MQLKNDEGKRTKVNCYQKRSSMIIESIIILSLYLFALPTTWLHYIFQLKNYHTNESHSN